MNKIEVNRRDILVVGAGIFFGSQVVAQANYPAKALKVIVPQPAGGGFDFVSRVLAERLSKRLGQPIIVENKPGAGTVVGTEFVSKAEADGYTLLTGAVSNIALNMGLYKNLSYDSVRDFSPVGIAVAYSYTLMARKGLGFNSLKDIIEYAKNNPGKLTYASAGNGSGQHVIAAASWNEAKVDITHVPYKGAQPAYQDLLGGRVDLFFDLSSTARAHIESGGVQPIAVSSAQRQTSLPQTPTLIESGINIDLESWFGFFVPSGTPAAVQQKLRTELAEVIASEEVISIFVKAGGRPLKLSQQESQALVQKDIDRWTKIVRELGISIG